LQPHVPQTASIAEALPSVLFLELRAAKPSARSHKLLARYLSVELGRAGRACRLGPRTAWVRTTAGFV
jgi:hypothetical protein